MKELERVLSELDLFQRLSPATLYRVGKALEAFDKRLDAVEIEDRMSYYGDIDKRLTALEVDGTDSYAHYADSFADVAHDFDQVDDRLDALEAAKKPLPCNYHNKKPHRPYEIIGSFLKISEVHWYPCCKGCLDYPCPECDVCETIEEFTRRVKAMKCNSKPKTCGTCGRAYKRGENWMLVCFTDKTPKGHGSYKCCDYDAPACPNFEAIQ